MSSTNFRRKMVDVVLIIINLRAKKRGENITLMVDTSLGFQLALDTCEIRGLKKIEDSLKIDEFYRSIGKIGFVHQ